MSRNNPDIGWGIKGYMFSRENPVVHLSQTDVEKCLSNVTSLDEKYKDEQHRFRNEMVNLQLQMFVLEMWNIFSREIENGVLQIKKGPCSNGFCNWFRSIVWKSVRLIFTHKSFLLHPNT